MASPQLQLKRGQVQTPYGREKEHRQLAGAALGNEVQGLHANSGGGVFIPTSGNSILMGAAFLWDRAHCGGLGGGKKLPEVRG